MERVRCLGEGLPIAEQWRITAVTWDQVISRNDKTQASRADILLCASVDDSILRQIDRLRAEVARHVTDKSLTRGYLVKGELCKLKALDCLVVAVVEEFGLLIDVPISWLSDRGETITRIICDLICRAIFFGLLDCTLRPCSRRQIVR